MKFKDTYINQGRTNNNYGGVNKVEAGKVPNSEERLLNYFDISEIPTNAIVQSATFSLYGKGGDNNAMIFTIENLNATFTENQVNWNNRATATPWTAPGAGSNVGTVWSSITIGTIKNVRHTWDVSNLVESWVATPANNHGILIRQNGSVNKKKQFATKEGSLAERPILTVTYVVPAPCTAIPNRAPLAQPDFATIKSTDTVWVKPLTNDKDPDVANTLSLNSIVAVTNGTAIAQGDSLRFIPTLGFNGIATVRYVISDNFGLRDTALIRITCTNAAPIAQNDIVSNLSGTTFNILVKSNDLDPEGDTLSVPSIIVHPKHGEAKVVGSSIQYIPNDGYTGKDTIRYSICETIFDVNDCQQVFLCDSAYIFITVANRPPVANDDTKVTYLCFESVFGILENDSNPEQTDITISIINGPHRGTVRIGEDDKLYYRANNGFIGNDTIVYVITDSDNPPLSDTARVYIEIQMPVNEPPVAMNDYEETGLYETLYASVLDNDSDPDGDPLTVSLRPDLLMSLKGTAEVLANGLIKYTPFPGAFGLDSLDYQICEGAITDTSTCREDIGFCDIARLYIDIKVFNTTYAVDDENSTWINTPVGGNVPSNDFDKEGDMQTFGSFLNPTKTGNITSGSIVPGIDANGNPVTNAGTLTFNPDGSYIYTPALDFIGDISVPYFLCDNGTPTVCDTAYLDITVSPLPNISNSIIANNDEYFTYGSPINSDVFVNDADPQGDHFTLTSYRYDSDGDGIPDATGTIGAPITVAGVREDGAAVANAGTLTQRADGTFTFVSTPGFVGQVTYNYTITDDGTPVATDHANVVITVVRDENGPLNDPPFAGDDFSYTPINTPVKGNFINNDNDPNNNPISYNGITIDPNGPAASIDTLTTEKGGLVVIHQDGTYTYYPPTDYIGPDRVEYEICDVTVIEPQPLCADATIHLLVGTGYKISGNVYNDGNGMTDNILNGTGTHSDGKIYAVLTDTNGLVLQSVPVKPDGTWEFENVPGGIELTILIDTVHRNKNEIVTVSTLPENWIHTGEKNGIGSGHDGNIDGISNIIPPLTADVDQINFGIERPPVADNKLYIVANSAFKEGAPNGYPDINDFDRYFTISTGSSQLLNNGRGGSLTGKDAEDCPSDQECHTGSTFKLEQVYPSTILYYDYGGETGIRRLQEGDVIPSYNPDNLIIYANEGSGTTDSPVGFNYSMIDGAGVSGSPATYVIFTENPLPVELLIFTANVLECQIKLSWATASELNNKYFEIQRSYDAKSWVVIGEISGNGTSNMRHDYQFLDAIHEQNNTIYYRLKQVDYDGTVEFHKMISIQTVPCHPVDIGVYPNPVQKVLNVKTNGINENIYIELTDLTGRTILRKMAESHVTQLDVSNLLSGTYLISIKDKINKVLKSTKIEIIR